MNLTAYILDDEQHAIDVLINFIGRTNGIELIGYETDPLRALQHLDPTRSPDLIFADIDMPELNGLEFGKLIGGSSALIFTTSFREYGPEAYTLSAIDYLLKPISYERFLQSIQKVRSTKSTTFMVPAAPDPFYVTTEGKGKMELIRPEDVFVIESSLNYLLIYFEDRRVVQTYGSMKEILERLGGGFTQVHRSFIVNQQKIKYIEREHIMLTNGQKVSIGRSYYIALMEVAKTKLLTVKRPG